MGKYEEELIFWCKLDFIRILYYQIKINNSRSLLEKFTNFDSLICNKINRYLGRKKNKYYGFENPIKLLNHYNDSVFIWNRKTIRLKNKLLNLDRQLLMTLIENESHIDKKLEEIFYK